MGQTCPGKLYALGTALPYILLGLDFDRLALPLPWPCLPTGWRPSLQRQRQAGRHVMEEETGDT